MSKAPHLALVTPAAIGGRNSPTVDTPRSHRSCSPRVGGGSLLPPAPPAPPSAALENRWLMVSYYEYGKTASKAFDQIGNVPASLKQCFRENVVSLPDRRGGQDGAHDERWGHARRDEWNAEAADGVEDTAHGRADRPWRRRLSSG